jgi:hypothetical protein
MSWNNEQQPSFCLLSHNVMLNDASRSRTHNDPSETNKSLPETVWPPCQVQSVLLSCGAKADATYRCHF